MAAADLSPGAGFVVVDAVAGVGGGDGSFGPEIDGVVASTPDEWTATAPYSPAACARAATVRRIVAAITARTFTLINPSPQPVSIVSPEVKKEADFLVVGQFE